MIASGFNATSDVCIYDEDKPMDEACIFINWREIIPPGTKITQQLKAQGILGVLTETMQLMALNLFRENGITVFKSVGKDLYSNLTLLSEGKLEYYSVSEALENNKLCGGECSDCAGDTSCEK